MTAASPGVRARPLLVVRRGVDQRLGAFSLRMPFALVTASSTSFFGSAFGFVAAVVITSLSMMSRTGSSAASCRWSSWGSRSRSEDGARGLALGDLVPPEAELAESTTTDSAASNGEQPAPEGTDIVRTALDAERRRLIALRADGTIGDTAFQQLEQEKRR